MVSNIFFFTAGTMVLSDLVLLRLPGGTHDEPGEADCSAGGTAQS